jgi:hypothetical protein
MTGNVLAWIVTVAAIAANLGAAWTDFTRADFALARSVEVGVPSSLLPLLGTLKVAGALGLLAGLLGAKWIGVAAATGLVLFFLSAIGVHVRAREHHHVVATVLYLLLALAALLGTW